MPSWALQIGGVYPGDEDPPPQKEIERITAEVLALAKRLAKAGHRDIYPTLNGGKLE